ncbi:DUF2867 domain-containing protein [Pendulispora brunnea]|uniref:DUF2867 domain-containing protein n=1 Tax=Pendulispora brunnea TaxID=2905690 RepID=A0ABZ2KHK6_9BACT
MAPPRTRDLARVDFRDQHEGPPADASLDELVHRLFRDRPRWVDIAMSVRHFLVRPFGLDTTSGSDAPRSLTEGTRAGPFWILSVNPDEIVAGLDDRHLDFRVYLTKKQGLVVRTDVSFHNALGRIYFALIRLGHVWVVRSMLRRTVPSIASAA